MKHKLILTVVLPLTIVAVVFFITTVFFKSKERGDEDMKDNIEVFSDSENISSFLDIQNIGESSIVTNTIHSYNVTVSNDWKIKAEENYFKLLPEDDLSSINDCVLTISTFDSEGSTPEDLINENIEYAAGFEVRNQGPIQNKNHSGLLQWELEEGNIVSETAYIDRDGKIYGISSYYESTHKQDRKADYDTCHPLFEDLLESFTINH